MSLGNPELSSQRPIGAETRVHRPYFNRYVAASGVLGAAMGGVLTGSIMHFSASGEVTVSASELLSQPNNPIVLYEEDPEDSLRSEQAYEEQSSQTDNPPNQENNEIEDLVDGGWSSENIYQAEHQPLFMDAETPTELIQQFKANIECVSGTGPIEVREICAYALTGYDGTWSDITEHYLSLARWSDNQRNRDPDWQYDFDIEIIDSTIPQEEKFDRRDAVTELIVRYSDNYDSPEYLRYTFLRVPVRTVTENLSLEQDVSEREVWAFRRSTIVEPGTRIEVGY